MIWLCKSKSTPAEIEMSPLWMQSVDLTQRKGCDAFVWNFCQATLFKIGMDDEDKLQFSSTNISLGFLNVATFQIILFVHVVSTEQ